MLRIDADCHVDETEASWEYLEESECRFKPTRIDPGVRSDQGWLVVSEDDLPYILKFGMEDNLLVGTDYTPISRPR